MSNLVNPHQVNEGPNTLEMRSPLKLGMCGRDVAMLQDNLNHYGIRDEKGGTLPVTGIFDEKTEGAVREAHAKFSKDGAREGEDVIGMRTSPEDLQKYMARERARPGEFDAEDWRHMEHYMGRDGKNLRLPEGVRDLNFTPSKGDEGRQACDYIADSGNSNGRERPAVMADASHPNRPLYDAIRGQLPASVPDAKAAEATLHAVDNGIATPDKLKGVAVRNDQIHVEGTTPGFRASVDLTKPAPSVEEVNVRLAAANQPNNTQEVHQNPSHSHGARAFG